MFSSLKILSFKFIVFSALISSLWAILILLLFHIISLSYQFLLYSQFPLVNTFISFSFPSWIAVTTFLLLLSIVFTIFVTKFWFPRLIASTIRLIPLSISPLPLLNSSFICSIKSDFDFLDLDFAEYYFFLLNSCFLEY